MKYDKYRRRKKVKVCVSIPEYLHKLAKEKNISFSWVLTDALVELFTT